MAMRTSQQQLGFTLIEVMVALMIVGIALPALMFQLSTQLDSTNRFRQQTIAGWVARNQVSQIQIQAAAGVVADSAFSQGESELAGTRWQWQVTVEQTPVPGLLRHRVDVSAAQAPSDILASLTSYIQAGE